MSVMVIRAFAFGVAILLSACGGGGGDGGGFLPAVVEPELTIVTSDLPSVTQLPYASVIEVTGGAGGYTWSLVSDGGTGFTLDASGVLRGDTLLALGTYGITVRVEDSDGLATERSFTLLVETQVLSIATTALPEAEEGVPYSTVLEAAGGSTPYSWLLLDDGDTELTLSSAGVLSGLPPTAGTYGFTFEVVDAAETRVVRSLTVDVTDQEFPLLIGTESLPQVQENERYSAVLSAFNGTGDYQWTLVSSGGSGFALTSAGVLTGTAPSAGVYGLTFRVDDGVSQATRSLTVTVTDDDTPLAIETDALPDGVTGTSYAAVITATGGTGNYSWALLDGGSSGLSLTANGVVRGVPFSSGSFGITVRVNDGRDSVVRSLVVTLEQRQLSDDEIPQVLTIDTDSLPSTAPGERYAAVISAEGGSGAYTFSLVSAGGAGLSLSPSGVLSGTAPAAGIYGLTVQVQDGSDTATRALTLSVIGDGPSALTISTASLPNPVSGSRYAAVLSATGGDGNYTWSLPNGGGGTGLSINAAGVLSGVAGPAGAYGLSISVIDGEGTVTTESFALSITGESIQPLAITTDALPTAIAGTVYRATLTATGGTGNYSWSQSDDGGSGLTLDTRGVLRGRAPAEGTYTLAVTVTDGTNTDSASLLLTITGAGDGLVIVTSSLPSGTVGTGYSASLSASGGAGGYVWTLADDGGTGLTLSDAGVLSGTAPAVGTYGLTVEVEDSDGEQESRFLTLTIIGPGDVEPLVITTTSLPDATTGATYAAALNASGGVGGFTWTLTDDGGSGLTLDAGGALRGEAPAIGTYALNVSVTDGASTARASLIVTVTGETLTIATAALPEAQSGSLYAAVLEATGGSGVFTWTLVEDGGTGLIVDGDGVLRGTVAAAGDYGLTVDVEDSDGATARRSFVLTVTDAGGVVEPLAITTTTLPAAQTGTRYAAVIEGSGGDPAAYNFTLLDDGGSGLNLNFNVLEGTAPAPGNYGVVVQLSDGSDTVARSLVLTVSGDDDTPLAIDTTSLPPASTDTPYVTVLEASGGSGAGGVSYTWSLVADGGLGSEIALDTNGILSGTVTTEGLYGLTFEVSDGTSTQRESLVLSVDDGGDQALAVITETLPDIETSIYAAVLAADGGVLPYTWDIVASAANPAGFDVSEQGLVTLTAAQVPPPGLYPLTAQVTDSSPIPITVQRAFSVVRAGGVIPAVEFTTDLTLPEGEVGVSYATVIRATGGGPPESYTFTLLEMQDSANNVVPPANRPSLDSQTGVLFLNAADSTVLGPDDYTLVISVEAQVNPTETDNAATATFTLQLN